MKTAMMAPTTAAALLSPLWWPASAIYRRRVRRYDAGVFAENAMPLARASGFELLGARSLVVTAQRVPG